MGGQFTEFRRLLTVHGSVSFCTRNADFVLYFNVFICIKVIDVCVLLCLLFYCCCVICIEWILLLFCCCRRTLVHVSRRWYLWIMRTRTRLMKRVKDGGGGGGDGGGERVATGGKRSYVRLRGPFEGRLRGATCLPVLSP